MHFLTSLTHGAPRGAPLTMVGESMQTSSEARKDTNIVWITFSHSLSVSAHYMFHFSIFRFFIQKEIIRWQIKHGGYSNLRRHNLLQVKLI